MKDYKQVQRELTELNADGHQDSTDEALTAQQRMKLKQSIRRNKAKIRLGREKAKRKTASPEVLQKRANKQARNAILKKILKNKDKSDLSYSQRSSIEKQLDKKKSAIKRLAKQHLPKIRKADRAKLSGGKKEG